MEKNMKNKISMSVIITAMILAGCSTLPPLDMVLDDIPKVDQKGVELKSITVGYAAKTKGVKLETNHLVPPAWQTALEDAINRSLIFGDDKARNITISVRIYHFDLPAAGFAMVSDCGALYEIMDRSTGNIIFSERILTSGTTELDYAFAGVARVQESINRCARNNIYNFLSKVDSAKI